MGVFTAVILIGLAYGLVRLLQVVIKELALFAIEAWRDGETEQ